ncbi:MAG: glycosyltransferase family 2 protein [Phycisphaerales bacterium]|nr:MAG: glycosyltransferase family 2 protein [Phycisphaerales bacterium]
MAEKKPFVSVIIPMRNEARYIQACLETLLGQDYPTERMEIIVADGMSKDGSREIVERFAKTHPNIKLIDNPEGIVPPALNRAIRVAQGEYILRADAHAEYGNDYISQCVHYLQKTGADNVGGPLITLPGGENVMARVVAALTTHPIVVGGSKFRTSMKEEYADTAVFGAFPRGLFDRIGFFNEALVRNQDNEFNSRIIHYGGKIFKTPKVVVRYYNQRTLRGLLRQAYRNGMWNVLTLIANPWSFKFRYFAPFGFVSWLLGFGILSIFFKWALWPLGFALISYALVTLLVAGQTSRTHGLLVALILPMSMFLYHVAYGFGSFAGIVRFCIFGAEARRNAREGSRPPEPSETLIRA